jgi:hypothetical protein
MTFTVNTGLAFVVNDFVLISAVDTPITTTTTTTSPIVDCVEFVNIEVTGAGNVTYLDCNGDPQLQNVGIGPEVIGTSLYCVQWSTLSGTATFTIDSLGPSCTLTTTTTTTTINTTTTTSTTTVAPTTTTTSTTTTAAPSYRYSAANPGDACNSGLTMTNVVLTGGAFCSAATTIQCDEFTLEAAAITLYVSFGGNYRTATINDPNVSGIATFDTSCTSCP